MSQAIPTATALLDEAAWQALADHGRLSAREVQIGRCIFTDSKEARIAHELGISPHTVRTHVERLYRKLGVCSRAGFILCLMTTYLSLARKPGSGVPPICGLHAAGRCPFRH